jgi:hypothetical protein
MSEPSWLPPMDASKIWDKWRSSDKEPYRPFDDEIYIRTSWEIIDQAVDYQAIYLSKPLGECVYYIAKPMNLHDHWDKSGLTYKHSSLDFLGFVTHLEKFDAKKFNEPTRKLHTLMCEFYEVYNDIKTTHEKEPLPKYDLKGQLRMSTIARDAWENWGGCYVLEKNEMVPDNQKIITLHNELALI